MKKSAIIVCLLATGLVVWYAKWVRDNHCPYDELQFEWSYGATNSVPSVKVWTEFEGKKVECPVWFGGLNHPDFRFIDYDGDGKRDIVFENDRYMQVVAFKPASGKSPPVFTVLRNDVTWP